MTVKFNIEDGTGTGRRAKVTTAGQLVVAPLDYTTLVSNKLDIANTAYNFVKPVAGYKIVITDIFLYANKNVGVNDAVVTIYAASDGATSTTVAETILETEMLKQTSRDFANLNIIVANTGRWVNAKTDDDDIFCQIGYYYVPSSED